MRLRVFVLAFVLIPTLAAAQPLDITDEALPPLETDDDASASPPVLDDLEDQVNSKEPALVEPKFDMTAEEPGGFDGAENLHRSDPQPAPGLVIKIPTK